MASLRDITVEELCEHNKDQDCWVCIDGLVYDVSKYMDDHPGGPEVMVGATGIDATDDFENIGHSSDAREKMKEFLIGKLQGSFSSKASKSQSSSENSSAFNVYAVVIPALIVLAAVAIRYLS